MKTRSIATASSIVLALALTAPPVIGADQGQSPVAAGQTRSSAPAPLANKRVEEVTGAKIVDQTGEEIGKIAAIVRSKETHQLQAVVSFGGILGVGSKEVILPVAGLQLQGSRLMSPLARTQDQLEAQTAYEKARYDEVSGDQMVALGGGSGAIPGGDLAAFAALDTNKDGYLSKAEAGSREVLTEEWGRVDRNHDGKIDQGEFAAFEESGALDTPAHLGGATGSPAY